MSTTEARQGNKRTNWVVFQHREWTMGSRAGEGLVVSRQGHGDEAHGDGARLGCSGWSVAVQSQFSFNHQ